MKCNKLQTQNLNLYSGQTLMTVISESIYSHVLVFTDLCPIPWSLSIWWWSGRWVWRRTACEWQIFFVVGPWRQTLQEGTINKIISTDVHTMS